MILACVDGDREHFLFENMDDLILHLQLRTGINNDVREWMSESGMDDVVTTNALIAEYLDFFLDEVDGYHTRKGTYYLSTIDFWKPSSNNVSEISYFI